MSPHQRVGPWDRFGKVLPTDPAGRQFRRLRWLTTIVPAIAASLYETIRHSLLDRVLPTDYGNLLVGLLVLVLAYGFSTVVFRIIGHLQAEAVERSQQLAALHAGEAERERLSRDLHDGFAQLVAFLLVRIDTVEGLLTANRVPEAVAELEHLRGSAGELYGDVREAISGLRAQVVERGLQAALEDFAEAFGERNDLDVQVQYGALPSSLPPTLQLQLFRIIQEALTNVRRHAQARHAWVRLGGGETGIEVTIADDGRGFDPDGPDTQRPSAYGLATMRERAESCGGSLHIESGVGRGTRITVTIPLLRPGAERRHGLAALARR